MHQLSPFTCRRLSQLPRLTSVWECDRRPLPAHHTSEDTPRDEQPGDCILWVDSLQGVVRGVDVVPRETGHEAIVRTLLQAIESPQGRVEPARPRKVVVCDREIQFFLRGALQALDIPVEHVPRLPMIDEVFDNLQAPSLPEHNLPKHFEPLLFEKSALLWEDAPWTYLSEQEILAIELNCWDIETLHLSVLGFAGVEYGLLLYRDLDSLKQFRHKLLHGDDTSGSMQQAFLEQNCLFINFNPVEDVIPIPSAFNSAAAQRKAAVEYEFGSLHPLEGLRSQLADEEAASLIVALEALHRFIKKHDLGAEDFALTPTSSRFRIPNPAPELGDDIPPVIPVKISTVPAVSRSFLAETFSDKETAAPVSAAAIIDDSVPEGSLILLSSYRAKDIESLRNQRRIYYQPFLSKPKTPPGNKAKWPVLIIQTTRPKAKELSDRLQREGGIQSICFNPGSDPMSGQVFQIGLLQTAKGHLHLFNEYEISDPNDSRALDKWMTASADNDHCFGCIIASGSTGSRRGRPTIREVVAFFEGHTKQPEALGLMPLVMGYAPDW